MIQAKPLKFVSIITDRDKGKKVVSLLNRNDVLYHVACLGHGTAHTDFEAYSGLGEPEKALVLCICSEEKREKIFQLLKTEMDFELHGTGIAFSIPINSASCMDAVKFVSGVDLDKEGL